VHPTESCKKGTATQISRLAIELAEMESDEAEDDGVPRLINVGPESLGAFRGLRHLFFDCSCTWSMVYTLRYVLSRAACF